MDKQQRSFEGKITKLIENFGFIDDDVFFRIEVVEGGPVKINDYVYVECEYSEQLPFKWNATKVKLVNSRAPATYLQHRMQQMLQQHSMQQPANNLNAVVAQQQLSQKNAQDSANFFTPELRKMIEKQQQQTLQNYQQNIQNNQQFNRQNDFNQSPAFSGQITYTSTPGAAFVSPVLPFNQPINVPQQTLPLSNLRAFSNNQPNNYPKRDNLHNRKDRDDHKNMRDNRGIGNRGKDNRDDHRDRHRDNDRPNREDKRNDSIRDRDIRDNSRDSRDLRDRKNTATTPAASRDRRTTESPSNSITSSSNTSKPRRRYTPLHIPVHEILKSPINSYDIKRKFDSSIHIPSDFKELQINSTFELNFQSLHKPIQYRIVHSTSEKDQKGDDSDKKENSSSEKKKEENIKDNKDSKEVKDAKEVKEKDVKMKKSDESTGESKKDDENSKDGLNDKSNSKSSDKNEEKEAIKNEDKTDLNKSSSSSKKKPLSLSNKYAVKVLLLSVPSMNNIYDRVIESDRDKEGYSSNNKAYFLHFNKIFSYLCLKNHNDGHSLIGGKFDAKLDGYIGENQPNLIQTAIRCVKQQTGIDLSSCKKWKHMCTFLYNRDDSLFYDNVPFEYSNIFIPDVWSLLENPNCIKTEVNSDNKNVDNKFVDKLTSSSSQNNSIKEEKVSSTLDDLNSLDSSSKMDCANGGDSFNSLQVNPSDSILTDLSSSSINNSKLDNPSTNQTESIIDESTEEHHSVDFNISQLNELKVTELRARLEELGHKTAKNVKKADLVAKLTTILKSQQTKEEVSKLDQTDEESNAAETKEEEQSKVDETMETGDSQIEVKESEGNNHVTETITEQSSNKRKADDESSSSSELQTSKKIKKESTDEKIDSKESKETIHKPISDDGFIMAYGSITVLNLYQALNHNKYDHFELQIVSELLKEALISHFGNFILSACYENRHLIKEQQDDSKKDDSKKEDSKKDDSKKEDSIGQKDIIENNNYVLLAFSYFDSCHCGYVLTDDLLKLLSNCGINFSKRTWTHIFGTNDRIKYGNFKEPTKTYNFNLVEKVTKQNSSNEVKSSLYIKDGNVFDIDKLISQSESDEKLKVELKDKLRLAEESIKTLQANLIESNNKQSKMANAFKKQNDEICDYKRDKEKIKFKYEESLKLINSTLGNLNDFIKKHEDKNSEKVKEETNK